MLVLGASLSMNSPRVIIRDRRKKIREINIEKIREKDGREYGRLDGWMMQGRMEWMILLAAGQSRSQPS